MVGLNDLRQWIKLQDELNTLVRDALKLLGQQCEDLYKITQLQAKQIEHMRGDKN